MAASFGPTANPIRLRPDRHGAPQCKILGPHTDVGYKAIIKEKKQHNIFYTTLSST
jgi:hypothetical protein